MVYKIRQKKEKEKVRLSVHKKEGILCHYHCHNKTGKLIKHTDHPLFTENTERIFRITLPIYDNSGRFIKAKERENVAKSMARHFQGVTIQKASGWHIEDHEYVPDETVIMSSAREIPYEDKHKTNSILKKDNKFIEKMAKRLAIRYGQESIMIQDDISGKVRFVEGTGKRKSAMKKATGKRPIEV